MTEPASNLPAERKPQLTSGGAVAAFIPQTLDELYRLGNVMSASGLSPFKTPEAAAIAIMAGAELGFSPAQACQSLAVVNSKAVLWGDAIPALLLSNGFKIREWLENEAPDYPLEMRAVCEITRPDGQVFTEGFSVADAKEANLWGKSGPWQTAKKRMMKMRARSFCARDGASDVLRGLYVAEEVQDFQPIPGQDPHAGTGMVERLKARAQPADVDPAGFNVRTITDETNAAKPRKARAKASEKAQEPDTPADGVIDAEVAEIPPADAAGAAVEVLKGDDLPDGLARPTETAGVQGVDASPASSASATPASGASAAGTSSRPEPEPPLDDGADEIQEGCAAPAEVYMHPDFDDLDENGRRATFRDGMPFSRSAPQDSILIYAEHSPRAVVEDDAGDASPLEGVIGEVWAKITAATSWLQVKPLLPAILNSDDFAEMDEDEQDALEAKLWGFVETELRGKHRDPVDQAMDITAFRLWSAWMAQKGREGADAIEGTFPALKTENPAWDRLKDDQRATFEKRTYRRINTGGKG